MRPRPSGRAGRIAALVAAVVVVVASVVLVALPGGARVQAVLGVTFSPRYARSLGLDPRQTFTRAVDELAIRYVRLPIYWDEVEQRPGSYDFSSADFYMDAADRRGVVVIPVLGYKLPRWPECFAPRWADRLTIEQRRAAILQLIRVELEHFRGVPSVGLWQVENEPFFRFGQCGNFDVLDQEFVGQEVALVRQLDNRPVLITDSGEFSTWIPALHLADCFGSTLYRAVWLPWLGVVPYPFAPGFYAAKDRAARSLVGGTGSTIVAELQAEPWFWTGGSVADVSLSEQVAVFPAAALRDHVQYAQETGFSAIYLWGVEWWYWVAQRGHPEYLADARDLFGQNGGPELARAPSDPLAGCEPARQP